MRRLEQIMGDVSQHAPPELVHEWQDEIRDLIARARWEGRQEGIRGTYAQLEQNGVWQQPH